jgi:preprotein translocase subunit YajC
MTLLDSFLLIALQGVDLPGLLKPLTLMGALFAVFYFMLVMPVRKRQRSLDQLLGNLKKGDRVVTSGGLYGEVAAINGPAVILKIADNVKVRVAKSAITGLEGEPDKGTNP